MLIPLRRPITALTFSILVFSSAYLQTQTNSSDNVDQQKLATDYRPPADSNEIVIPGPLRSFLRMAGISQKVSSEEVIPLVARNVYVQGYQGWQEGGRPTEFLILLGRYVNQAK
jgi:hypothetical protein